VPPNIVLIVADQLKPEATEAYGARVASTPNLARAAREGVVFDRCYANSAICGPCRYALFTGTYPFAQPEWATPNCAANRGVKYLGRYLTEAGYQSVALGRLHGMPESFEFQFELCKQQWGHFDFAFNDYGRWLREKLAARPDGAALLDRFTSYRSVYPGRVLDDETFFPRELSEEAWMLEETGCFLDQRTDPRPFFLHLGLVHPHLPWLTLRTDDEIHDPASIALPPSFREYSPRDRPVLEALKAGVSPTAANTAGFTERDWRIYASHYYGAVGQVDKCIGGVMELLCERGLDRDTVVIITSDHGEQLGAFGLDQKVTLYDAAVHIPLLIWGAGVPRGERRTAFAEQVDLIPTLLDLAGADPGPDPEGMSLWPAVQSGDSATKPAVFGWLAYNGAVQASIRTDRFKLYRLAGRANRGEAFELFDLAEDPHEINNVFNAATGPEVADLKREFCDFFERRAGFVGCPWETRERLLG